MIAQLRGTLAEKGLDHVVLDVGGVGYLVLVSLQTLGELGPVGSEARLRTYLQVREDALTLFGFATEEERAAFELVTGVQGIGPKIAMSILSALAPAELAAAVKAEDTARLRRVPGVGQKTAERMVLELRDKLERAGLVARPAAEVLPQKTGLDPLAAQVASALVNLGYKPAEAERAALKAAAEHPGKNGASTNGAPGAVTDLIKRALRALGE